MSSTTSYLRHFFHRTTVYSMELQKTDVLMESSIQTKFEPDWRSNNPISPPLALPNNHHPPCPPLERLLLPIPVANSPALGQAIATSHKLVMMVYQHCIGVQARTFWCPLIGMVAFDVGKYKNREVKCAPCPKRKVSIPFYYFWILDSTGTMEL